MRNILVLLFLLLPFSAWAQDLEEATGLADEPEESARPAPSGIENLRYRSYILVEGVKERTDSVSESDFPNIEASLSMDYKKDGFTYFLDGLVNYTDDDKKTQSFLNQLGVRYQATEQVVLAIGKERNRRSPGIVVSPSDLLFTQAQLPGLREDRQGLWLGRASYQRPQSSYDLFLLPVNATDEYGWPEKKTEYYGTVVRTLQQFENLDLSVSLGELGNVNRAGLAAQFIFAKVWKTYYEFGYQEDFDPQNLVGISYEGSDDYGFKLEYFHNGPGAAAGLFPFVDQNYGIVTVSAIEWKNHWNFFLSYIQNLEDKSNLALGRAEYLVSDHLVGGLTALVFNGNPFLDERYALDLKYTF